MQQPFYDCLHAWTGHCMPSLLILQLSIASICRAHCLTGVKPALRSAAGEGGHRQQGQGVRGGVCSEGRRDCKGPGGPGGG